MRRCEVCDKPIPRPAWMHDAVYAVRRFCSRQCTGAGRRIRPATSSCVTCGKDFPSRSGRDRLNLYCSVSCAAKARPLKEGVDLDARGRHEARVLYPDVEPCEVCGDPGTERHHRDGNRLNNARSNIAFLCRPHHAAEHRRMAGIGTGKRWGGGRPRVVELLRDRAIVNAAEARRLRAEGLTIVQIAARLDVNKASVSRWFLKYPEADQH